MACLPAALLLYVDEVPAVLMLQRVMQTVLGEQL
jgi:hypothetical protein